jgi:hypothetical protein
MASRVRGCFQIACDPSPALLAQRARKSTSPRKRGEVKKETYNTMFIGSG